MFGYAIVSATTRSEKLVLTYLSFQALVDQRIKCKKCSNGSNNSLPCSKKRWLVQGNISPGIIAMLVFDWRAYSKKRSEWHLVPLDYIFCLFVAPN